MPGDAHAGRELRCGEQPLDVGSHGLRRVKDGQLGEGFFVGARPLGEPVAEFFVREEAGSAVGVVNEGNFEPRPFRCFGFDEVLT